MLKKVGIYGYGAFGKLMAGELSKFFEIFAFSPSLQAGRYDKHAKYLSEKDLFQKSDMVIFAIPVQFLETAAQNLAEQDFVPPKTPLIDVSSVKVYPLEILQKFFPNNPLLGTHPIFGPQSVEKFGLAGSKIVLSNISFSDALYNTVKKFLQDSLQLVLIEKSPQEHDKEMAYIQGLSHFIGRALAQMNIEEFATETFSYKHLVELKDLLKDDSWELFKTIQNYNPYAKDLRDRFIKTLAELDGKLIK